MVLGVALAWAGIAAAQDDAKTVLERAIKAHGGADTLTKRTAGSMKAKGRIHIMGGFEFTSQSSYELPDKFEETVSMEIAGQQLTVVTKYDGKKAAITVNGMEVPGLDKLDDEIKHAVHMMKIATLVPLRDKPFKLSLIGEEKVNDKPAVGIKVSAAGMKDVDVYFDKESGLLVKFARRGVDPMTGNEFSEERIVNEYQKQDNLPVPKKVFVTRDGNKYIELEILEFKYGK